MSRKNHTSEPTNDDPMAMYEDFQRTLVAIEAFAKRCRPPRLERLMSAVFYSWWGLTLLGHFAAFVLFFGHIFIAIPMEVVVLTIACDVLCFVFLVGLGVWGSVTAARQPSANTAQG